MGGLLKRAVVPAVAVPVIAISSLIGGTAQAQAAPSPRQVVAAAADATIGGPSAFTPWLCKKFRWGGFIC